MCVCIHIIYMYMQVARVPRIIHNILRLLIFVIFAFDIAVAIALAIVLAIAIAIMGGEVLIVIELLVWPCVARWGPL